MGNATQLCYEELLAMAVCLVEAAKACFNSRHWDRAVSLLSFCMLFSDRKFAECMLCLTWTNAVVQSTCLDARSNRAVSTRRNLMLARLMTGAKKLKKLTAWICLWPPTKNLLLNFLIVPSGKRLTLNAQELGNTFIHFCLLTTSHTFISIRVVSFFWHASKKPSASGLFIAS